MTNLSLTTKLGILKLLTQEMRNLGGTSDKLRKILGFFVNRASNL